MQQTFAQYLINKILPTEIRINKPVDNSVLKDILIKVYKDYPDQYDKVVTDLKNLGDLFSTYEGITMGIKEISVPNKSERDAILKDAEKKLKKATTDNQKLKILESTQNAIIKNDTEDRHDDATLLVKDSKALGSKKVQLVKLRSTPVVVTGNDGKITTELINKSYSEGLTPFHQWLQSAEARGNIAIGQTSTSSPGELSKIIHNTLASSVISMTDCKTKHGVQLNTDDDIVGRYFAPPIPPPYTDNTEITSQIQKDLLHRGINKVIVRSPQTCNAPAGTVCSKCAGVSISTGKPHDIGTNLGMITAGNLANPLTQMILSAKHSSTMAKTDDSLRGDKGFRQFVEQPKEFTNQKIFCEVDGIIASITPAPQGGKLIHINLTKPAQSRYIVYGKQDPKTKQYVYFIPPNRQLLKNIKPRETVYIGQPLTDGVNNLKDIARLQGLGITRTKAAEGMRNIYSNTNASVDRRHFELLARAAHNYLTILKSPPGFIYKRGEVVEYPEFLKAVYHLPKHEVPVDEALGSTLTDQYGDITAGTSITRPVIDHLKKLGITSVNVSNAIETEPATTALTRTVDRNEDWISILNHRRLKDNIINAAATGKKSDVRGWNPLSSYAAGSIGDSGEDREGKY